MKTTKTILLLLIAFIILVGAQLACQIVNKPLPTQIATPSFTVETTQVLTPSVAAEPTNAVIPSIEAEPSPEGEVILTVLVNIDGFAYAACMAINLQMGTIQDSPKIIIPCTDLLPSFRVAANKYTYLPISEWFISVTNTFIYNKGFPLEIQHHPSASINDIKKDLSEGVIPIAVVNTGNYFHAIVIGQYNSEKGIAYLDSLRPKSKGLPYENDFFEDYGIKFQEAWIDTFELKITK